MTIAALKRCATQKQMLRRLLTCSLAVLFAVFGIAFAQTTGTPQPPPPTVVFLTDFGVVDDSVALCKGVMYGVEPNLRIVDLTHQVTPFSIVDGARFLFGASPYFPAGTVFVAVIDPGVGSARRVVAVKTKRGQYFVLPDNGLMTLVEDRDGVESAREIENRNWMVGAKLSSTFHGRDIFSPVGAHIAHGEDWTQVGPEIEASKLVRLDLKAPELNATGIQAEIVATDGPFGNLVSNVDAETFAQLGYKLGEEVSFQIGAQNIQAPFVKTFSDVAVGKPLLYIDSRGHLGFAVNQGSAAKVYGVAPPIRFLVPRKKIIARSIPPPSFAESAKEGWGTRY